MLENNKTFTHQSRRFMTQKLRISNQEPLNFENVREVRLVDYWIAVSESCISLYQFTVVLRN